jgi:hypothetical protein
MTRERLANRRLHECFIFDPARIRYMAGIVCFDIGKRLKPKAAGA